MRLFLSSERLGNHESALLELVGVGKNAVFIMNAADLKDNRPEYTKSVESDLRKLGFTVVELDLRDYFDSGHAIKSVLDTQDLIWVAGGNTFVLNRAMEQSGFKEVVKSLVEEDRVAFGGWSAGAIVATPSLHGVEFGDEMDVIPPGYDPAIIWEALNLVPFHIIPHYNSSGWGDKARLMEGYLQKQNVSYQSLEDGQVIIVNGDKTEKLT